MMIQSRIVGLLKLEGASSGNLNLRTEENKSKQPHVVFSRHGLVKMWGKEVLFSLPPPSPPFTAVPLRVPLLNYY